MKLFAYLDPGTGTIIVQAVLGGVAGVAVLAKTVGSKFRRKSKTDDTVEPTDSVNTDIQPSPPTSDD